MKETVEMSLLAKIIFFFIILSFILSHHPIFPFPQWEKCYDIYFEDKWPNLKELYLYLIFSSLLKGIQI